MFGIGPMELVVIVVVALLIFGPQKLPEFARTLGKGLAEFRRASNDLRQSLAIDELQNDLRKTMNEATRVPPTRPAQAGDTLPPGAAGVTGSPAAPPWKGNPGELPEGQDHDHREPVARPADSALGSVPVGGAEPATEPDRG